MPAYFDSSVVLSLVLGDQNAETAYELWNGELERVGSILIDIECTTVLRRLAAGGLSQAKRKEAELRLEQALSEIVLKSVDDDIVAWVRATTMLSGCRSLDATHLATALFFREGAQDGELAVCTFDGRMSEVASRLGFSVLGCERRPAR